MAESQHRRHDLHGHNAKSSCPPSHSDAAKQPPNAPLSVESRRHGRPKLSSYITGQRAKPSAATTANEEQSCAFGPDLSTPAVLPETDRLLDSIHQHVLANPIQPLPPCFNSAFSYLIEDFRRLKDDLTQAKKDIVEERTDRQAAEKIWATEREGFEKEIERLKNSVDPAQDVASSSRRESQELMDLNGLQCPSRKMNQPGEHFRNLLYKVGLTASSPTLDVSPPTLSRSSESHDLRSGFKSHRTSPPQECDENFGTLVSPSTQDTKNLQTIASLVAKRQGMPIADVWNDVAYLYFDHFKANGREAGDGAGDGQVATTESTKGMFRSYDGRDAPEELRSYL